MKIYLIFILLFLIGIIFRTPELYYLVYIATAVLLVVYYTTKNAAQNLTLEREMSDNRIFRGENTEVNVSLKNNSLWPIFWLDFIEKVPVKLHTPLEHNVISLLPKEEVKQNYTLKGKARGLYNLGPLNGKLGDSLGLINKEFVFNTQQQLIVYPKIFPLDELGLPSHIAFGDLIWPQKIYRDPTSFRGLREYQKGDQIKDVYWPATASSNQLMVKEYESTISVENFIFLNLNQSDYGVERLELQIELAIEVTASVISYLINCSQTVALATNGEDPINDQEFIAAGQGAGHLMETMELLARIEMTEERSYLSVLERYSHQATPGSTILLITKLDTQELVTQALELCRTGLNVVIVVLGPQVKHHQYLNRPYTESLVIYQVKRKEDIYAWGS